MWIAQESFTLNECQFSDNRKSVVIANMPIYWGTVKEVKNNLWVGRSKNHGSRQWLNSGTITGLTHLILKRVDME